MRGQLKTITSNPFHPKLCTIAFTWALLSSVNKDIPVGNVQVKPKHAWSDGACHKQPIPPEAGAAPPRIPSDSMGTHAGQGRDEDLYNASVHQ